MEDYMQHLDFRMLDNFDDDAFAYLMENVKGVNMLDLNGTSISNKSISLLTRLEYIYELRLKECHLVDDDCIPWLNDLTSLKLLHVKDTGISLKGLLKLTGLDALQDLLFSEIDIKLIEIEMQQLKSNMPNCKFKVNGKPWQFNE